MRKSRKGKDPSGEGCSMVKVRGGAHPLLPLIAEKSQKRQRHSAATAAFNHISKSKPQMIQVASQVVYKLGHSGHTRPIFKSLRPTCAHSPN